MTAITIHPDVRNTLTYADTVFDHLLSHIEKIRAVTTERVNEDRDIAVKVDASGQLIDLWLKPGILDKKTAAQIAKEITRLAAVAGSESTDQVAELRRAAHDAPTFAAVVAEQEKHDVPEPK